MTKLTELTKLLQRIFKNVEENYVFKIKRYLIWVYKSLTV